MRGERERQATIMLAVTPEAFVPNDHPLRRIKPLVDECRAAVAALRGDVREAGASLDPARAPAQGELADRPLLGAQRAPVLRAVALQPALQVVPRPERRGRALQRHDLLQERERLLEAEVARAFFRGGGRGGPPAAALGRALQRGRDAAGGVGLAQELPSAGRAGAARVGRWAQAEVDFRGQRRSRETTCHAQTPRRGSTARDRSRRRS